MEECVATGACCWENRTIPHNLGVLREYAKRRGPTSRLVVVPDGVGFPTAEQRKHGQMAHPSASEQRLRAGKSPSQPAVTCGLRAYLDRLLVATARDQHYYSWCKAEELCVAMFVFLWRSVHTSTGWLTGVEDQTAVLLPALVQIGKAIKNGVKLPAVKTDDSDLSMDVTASAVRRGLTPPQPTRTRSCVCC